MATDPQRFGRLVLARRTELGLTQDDVTDRGGPSDTLLTQIEAGLWIVGTPSTLKKLDAGLDWEPGSARAAFAGGEPTVAGAPPTDPGHLITSHDLAPMLGRLADLERRANEMDKALREKGIWIHSPGATLIEGDAPTHLKPAPDLEEAGDAAPLPEAAHPLKGRESHGRRRRKEMDAAGEESQEMEDL